MVHYRSMFYGVTPDVPPMEPYIGKYIAYLRKSFTEKGGKPEDFSKYLRDSGCEMVGAVAKFQDTFMMAAKLRMD